MAAGVVLSSSFAHAQGVPAMPPPVSTTTPPATVTTTAQFRYAKASAALTAAINLQRRGDIEQAQVLFDEVQARFSELNATEQQEFTRLLQVNKETLKNRSQAREIMAQAEQAAQQGQPARAQELLKQVAPIEHTLSPYDRQRYDLLRRGNTAQARGTSGTMTSVPGGEQLARTKVQQARALMHQGNLDGAEQLAREADGMGVTFGNREDKPARVMEDIKKMRNDPKALLAGSRSALQSGNFDQAQALADAAEKAAGPLTFPIWGDTPSKVRKEIQAARKLKDSSVPAPAPVAEPNKPNSGAHAGKTETPVASTSAKPVETAPKTVAKVDPVNEAPVAPHEAINLLKQARTMMANGQLEEAEYAVTRARSASSVKYGLFDDTPDKVQTDLNKMRRKRDQAEGDRMLAQARKLYEQGNLAEARTLTFQAQTLHGPYDVWQLGDRPEKLLQDIQTAEAKGRKGAPPVVPNAPPVTQTPAVPVTQTGTKSQAVALMAEARKLQGAGKLLEARQKIMDAKALKASFGPNEESPDLMGLQLAALAQQRSNQLVQKATVEMSFAQTKPEMLGQAEQHLKEARALTAGFGLDTTPIDGRLSLVTAAKSALGGMPGAPTGGLQQASGSQQPGGVQQAIGKGGVSLPVPVPGPTAQVNNNDPAVQQGLKLLQDSLYELRRGNTVGARRFAEEAYAPQFKVKQLAQARLAEIDIEEFNQRKLETRRSFEAGVAAFNRREFHTARAILGAMDPTQLKDDRTRQRYREIMASPEMGPKETVAVGPTVESNQNVNVSTLPNKPGPGSSLPADAPGASITDQPEGDLMSATRAMQSVMFQKTRSDSLKVQQEANDRCKAGETQAAIELLQDFMLKLPESQLDRDQLALIKKPIEGRLERIKLMKQQDEYYKQDTDSSRVVMNTMKSKEVNERNKQKNVADLMKQFNTYFKEGKYKEAEMYAMLAHDIDPDNHIVSAAVGMARMQINVTKSKKAKSDREKMVMDVLNEAENEGPSVNSLNPMAVDAKRSEIARSRDKNGSITQVGGRKTLKTLEIERKLDLPTNLNFNNAPLRQMIDDIRALHGINIHPDTFALEQENISLERPISIQVENLALKSALNIALRQARLTWVIRDDVLQITTEAHARGKLLQKTFSVADLIIPIQNAGQPTDAITAAATPQQSPNGVSPYAGPNSMSPGQPVGSPTGSTGSAFGTSPTTTVQKTQVSQTMQDQLIKLITSSISPKSWSDMGGAGTIDYFPLTMSLVINQTQDIQEQIADLLAALRRLQDQEVAIEVRLITIAEGFYERMGLDFNIKIKTDKQTARFEPQLTTGTFKPAGFINDFNPSRFIAGLTPAGVFTNDLDIPIAPNTFNRAVPPFGPYPNMPGDNGGIALGLAFLSDIQVALFMEAAQGDQRSNVMQAPKLTMFNGQTARLQVGTSQNFVTGVTVNQTQNGLIFFVPQNTPFPQQVQLTLQPVISADRRFVRLSSTIQLTNLASATVPLFPIITPITPTFEGVPGMNSTGQPIIFTQFIQQPIQSTVFVETTVVVPDGGTVLMGGLKRMSEGRNEYGPPVLSKIPYINRLFKNVGYGRDTESLLLMVTPRIIISEEEEIIQTGVVTNPQLSQ